MKKFIAMTMVAFVGLVGNVYATPEEELTIEQTNILFEEESIEDILNTNVIDEKQMEIERLLEMYKGLDGAVSTVVDVEAKVRDLPSTEGNIVNFVKEGMPVYVKERDGNWYTVMVNDKETYIYKDQLDQTVLQDIPVVQVEEEVIVVEEEKTYLGDDIVAKAKQYLGNPYVYGGTSLTNGADCSGFVQQIFKQFGISLERTSRAQYASNGYKVTKSELLPGDLVFYGYGGSVSHVAIYAGNNQVVHANTAKTGICMSPLQENKPIIGMKRVIK